MRPVSSSLRFLFLFSTCINASESDSLNHNQPQKFHFSTRSSLIIRFDEVLTKRVKVQPSGWLGSGFDWTYIPLLPIYRECSNRLLNATDEEKEEKSGQIFGLFVSLTLAEYRSEVWYFVKDEGYEARGVPIRSRIYFLPEFETT